MASATSTSTETPVLEGADTSINTVSDITNGSWITIYKVGFNEKSDWGCMDPKPGTRNWTSGNYEVGDTVKIQAEVKDGTDCGGSTVYATDITRVLGYNSTFTLKQDQVNYYWEFDGD